MLVLLSLFILCQFICTSEANPIVYTKFGTIEGYYKKSDKNKTFAAFEGVPYAQPPIGRRRFQAPEEITKWKGVLDATKLYSCTQFFNSTVFGTEDCLYLNIYVPTAEINSSANLDVIEHIHGGGFMWGDNHFYATPEYLMDENVIFVTLNYRLGALGFLSTEDKIIPGNYGMKDQVMALRWVKSNIQDFGGNPNSITLTGMSAGGASVQLHYLSPLSRNLFKRGFSQSGTALTSWVRQRGAVQKTKALAKLLKCPIYSSEAILKCLLSKSDQEIVGKSTHFYIATSVPVNLFGVVIETGPNAFLTDEPIALLKSKKVQNLPWILALVKDETRHIIYLKDDLPKLNEIWPRDKRYYLQYTDDRIDWKSVIKQIERFYLGEFSVVTLKKYQNFTNMIDDRIELYAMWKSSNLLAEAITSPTYVYRFSFSPDGGPVKHGDDNQYFYYNRANPIVPNSPKDHMKDKMIQMLVTYAKTGVVKMEGENDWKPLHPGHFSFMEIEGPTNFTIHTNTSIGHPEFWDTLGILAF